MPATYDPAMPLSLPHRPALPAWGRAGLAWLAGWWQVLHLGAVLMVLALSPALWRQSAHRRALAMQLTLSSGSIVLGYSVVSALLSLVVIRIVVVTSLSYGLSQYALEMVVRVLVLELIPLTAALFAALRSAIPNGAEVLRMRRRGDFDALDATGIDPLSREVLPRVLAAMFSVAMLAAVSGVITLLLAYVSVHGLTLGGFERYTRTVGRVFSPAVSLIFVLKVLLSSAAVALIPMAAALHGTPGGRSNTSAALQGLVRMLLVLLVIEAASLVGNYY